MNQRFLRALLFGVWIGLAPSTTLADSDATFDPICAKYVKKNKFVSGDTTRWDTRVLPAYEKVLNDPQLQTQSVVNTKFKTILASYGMSEGKITEYNQNRIIADCSTQPTMEGCYAMQTYCVSNFVNENLGKAADKMMECFKPWNRPYCGEAFQTSEKISNNVQTLVTVESEIAKLLQQKSQGISGQYLTDVDGAFKDYSAKVQALQAKLKIELEAAKIQEAKKTAADFEAAKKNVSALGGACAVFDNCKTHIKDQDLEDNKSLLAQISNCEVKSESNPASIAKFSNAMEAMKKVGEDTHQKDALDIASKTFDKSMRDTALKWLISTIRQKGKPPSKAEFCKQMNSDTVLSVTTSLKTDRVDFKTKPTDCSTVQSEVYAQVTQNEYLAQIQPLNVGAEITAFNSKINELNKACMAGVGQVIEGKYQDLLYNSSFGQLMVLEPFRDTVGQFDQEACTSEGKGMKEIGPSDTAKVTQALDLARIAISEKAQEMGRRKSNLVNEKNPYEGLRYFLEMEPLKVREVIRESNDPMRAALLCHEIEEIYRGINRKAAWSTVLTVVSAVGGIAAIVLSGGLAAPAVFAIAAASTTIGVANGLNNYSNAKSLEKQYEQAFLNDTFDRGLAQGLIDQYHMTAKVEAIGVALQFIPDVGLLVGKAVSPTLKVVTKSITNSAMGKIIAKLPATKLLKPAADVLAMMKSGKEVLLKDLQLALATKVGPNTLKVNVAIFNSIAKSMPYDAAITMSTLALTGIDPFSEQGIQTMLISIAQGMGMSALGASGRQLLLSKKTPAQLKALGVKGLDVDGSNSALTPLNFTPSTNKVASSTTIAPNIQSLNFPAKKYQTVTTQMKKKVTDIIQNAPPEKRQVLESHRTHLEGLETDLIKYSSKLEAEGYSVERIRAQIWTHDFGKFVDPHPLVKSRHKGNQFAEFLDHSKTSQNFIRDNPFFAKPGKLDNVTRQLYYDIARHDGPAVKGSWYYDNYQKVTGRKYDNFDSPFMQPGSAPLTIVDRLDQTALRIEGTSVAGGPKKIALQVKNQAPPEVKALGSKVVEIRSLWWGLNSVPEGTVPQSQALRSLYQPKKGSVIDQMLGDLDGRITKVQNLRDDTFFFATKKEADAMGMSTDRLAPPGTGPPKDSPGAIGYVVSDGKKHYFSSIDEFYGTSQKPGAALSSIQNSPKIRSVDKIPEVRPSDLQTQFNSQKFKTEEIGSSNAHWAIDEKGNKAYVIHYEVENNPKWNEIWMKSSGMTPPMGQQRDVSAYALDQSLGLGIVPETNRIIHDGKNATAQKVVQGASHLDDSEIIDRTLPVKQTAKYKAEMEKLGTFDLIAGSTDRHSDNWMVTPAGKVWAIDNERSFPIQVVDKKWVKWSWENENVLAKPIDASTLSKIEAMSPTELRASMKKSGMDDTALDLMVGRVETIQKAVKTNPKISMQELADQIRLTMSQPPSKQNLAPPFVKSTLQTEFHQSTINTDEEGSQYIGYQKLSLTGLHPSTQKKEEIGYLSYQIDADSPDLMTIGWSRVDEKHRNQGIQTQLFQRVFASHPQVKRIRTSLDDVNQESFVGNLLKLTEGQKDYRKNTSTVDPKYLDRMTKKGNNKQREIHECCTSFLNDLKKSDPQRYEKLLDDALKLTPAWKTREKFGFNELAGFKSYNDKFSREGILDFKVEFDAHKPTSVSKPLLMIEQKSRVPSTRIDIGADPKISGTIEGKNPFRAFDTKVTDSNGTTYPLHNLPHQEGTPFKRLEVTVHTPDGTQIPVTVPHSMSARVLDYLQNGKPSQEPFDCNCFAHFVNGKPVKYGQLNDQDWNFEKISSSKKLKVGDTVAIYDQKVDGNEFQHVAIYLGNNRYMGKLGASGPVVVTDFANMLKAYPGNSIFQLHPVTAPPSKQSQRLSHERVRPKQLARELEKIPEFEKVAQDMKLTRSRLQEKIWQRRNQSKPIDTGYFRSKEFRSSWEDKSVTQTLEKFYPGQEFESVMETGGKVIISPKNKIEGREYIEIKLDASGGYFRLQKGVAKKSGLKFNSTKSSDRKVYVDADGKEVPSGGGQNDLDEFYRRTHFNARP